MNSHDLAFICSLVLGLFLTGVMSTRETSSSLLLLVSFGSVVDRDLLKIRVASDSLPVPFSMGACHDLVARKLQDLDLSIDMEDPIEEQDSSSFSSFALEVYDQSSGKYTRREMNSLLPVSGRLMVVVLITRVYLLAQKAPLFQNF